MRKYVILAMAALVSLALTSVAKADDIQSIETKVTPTKLDKKKFKPAKLFVDIITKANSAATLNQDQPPSATRTVVTFPKNLKFDPSAVDKCKVTSSAIVNTTSDQATDACGKGSKVSIDSGTSARIDVDTNPAVPGSLVAAIDVQVTAFNGKEKDTLYLHTDPENVTTKPVLVGKLKNNVLDVTVPTLGAGAIADFRTTVKAGKFIQARCKSSKNVFKAETTFSNFSSPKVTDTFVTKCKAKRR